jgi:hypothetical protein
MAPSVTLLQDFTSTDGFARARRRMGFSYPLASASRRREARSSISAGRTVTSYRVEKSTFKVKM